MTTFERFEGDLPMLLEELAPPRTPDYLDSVFGRTARSAQRPAWSFPERWLPMSILTDRIATAPRVPWRPILILALLLVAFAAAVLYVGTQQRRLPTPFGPAANGLIPFGSAGDIYLGNPVTGTTHLLVGGPENDGLVGFSPDGTRVAFVRPVGSGAGELPVDIYVVRADGSDQRPITTEPISGLSGISWTPDGRLAVIHPVETAPSASGPGRPSIGLDLFDADGSGNVKTLVTADAMDLVQFRPPDGREILFKGQVNGSYGLYATNADGTKVQPLLLSSDPEGDDYWGGATYAADGDRIFYTRPFERESPSGTCCTLWVMNANGSDRHEFIPSTGETWDGQPSVSPDGTRVAFWNGQVSVVPADGTGPPIPTGPALTGTTRHWVWAPDSSKILMYPDDPSNTSAYLLDPDGGPWTTVPWHQDGDLDWQRIAPVP